MDKETQTMKLLLLTLITTFSLAWDCSNITHKNKDYQVDELCRRAASYQTMEVISAIQQRENINFTTANATDRSTIASTTMRNAEECYITCLKSNSKRY